MAVKFTNNAKTTLASGINSSVTTATVTDGSVFPTLGSGEHFYCTFDDGTNNEIVKVTARSGNTLTIVRGVDNTTARAFSASDAAELRATSALLTDIQENIAAKSANQTVYSATTASSATSYDIGIDPGVEANASVFLNGVYQHHNTFSFSGSTLTFDTAPPNGMALEVLVDNLVNLQSSNLTVDTFTAADVSGNPQTDFILSDAPAAEDNLLVFIDGVFQDQDAYTISNQTLTITDGVTADFGVTVYVINPVNIGTPSDNTVTSSKLSGNITMPADLTVTGDVAFDSPTFVVDNANSRVGIGTASPSTLLDIVGDVKMSANLTVDTSTLVVDASNNRVGIGTDSPDGNLEVVTSTVVSGASDTVNNVLIGLQSANRPTIILDTADTTYTNRTWNITNVGASGHLTIGRNGLDVMTLKNDGLVGIGTSSPSYLFHVTGSGDTVAAVTAGASSIAALNLGNSTNLADGGIRYDNSADALIFRASNAEQMRLTSTGLGIGTNSPTNILHTSTSSNSVARFESTDATATIRINDTDDSLYVTTAGQMGSFGGNASVHADNLNVDLTNGRVGIGTTSPQAELHIEAEPDTAATGPVIRLARNDVYTSPDDSIGMIEFHTNDADSARVGAYIQATNQETYGRLSDLRFGVTQSNNAAATEAMRITSSGDITFKCGASTPSSSVVGWRYNAANTAYPWVKSSVGGSGGLTHYQFYNTNGAVGQIFTSGSGTTFATSSDYRLKENVDYEFNALDRVAQLKPARFNFIADADTTVDGFLAHEVQDIVPEAITGEKDAVKEEEYEITPAVLDDDGNVVTEAEMGTREVPDYQGIDQSKLVPLLTKAIQEQQELINNLTARIEQLEN